MKLKKKFKLSGVLTCITGLHIGDSNENAAIGGVDLPIVRNKQDNIPYIPGSSFKGKLRSLLEQTRGASKVGDSDEINDLFGMIGKREKQKPSRVIFRDLFMTKESENEFSNNNLLDLPFTEIKFENTIDRVKGKAQHPRQIERVPAGAEFNFEIILNQTDLEDTEKNSLILLQEAINLLENDYLGGNGTRGYGQVKIELNEPVQVYPKTEE